MGEQRDLGLAAEGLVDPLAGVCPDELGALQVVEDHPAVDAWQGVVRVVEELDALGCGPCLMSGTIALLSSGSTTMAPTPSAIQVWISDSWALSSELAWLSSSS